MGMGLDGWRAWEGGTRDRGGVRRPPPVAVSSTAGCGPRMGRRYIIGGVCDNIACGQPIAAVVGGSSTAVGHSSTGAPRSSWSMISAEIQPNCSRPPWVERGLQRT